MLANESETLGTAAQTATVASAYSSADDASSALVPTDVLRVPGTPYRPEVHAFALPVALSDALRFATEALASQRAILLASVCTLIHRYTQQEDFVLQLNVIDALYDTHRTFDTKLAARGARSARECIVAAASSLAAVDALPAAEGELTSTHVAAIVSPLAVALITGQLGDEQAILASLRARGEQNLQGPDLHITWLVTPEATHGFLTYDTSVFQRETIERTAGHLQLLLESMLGDPERPLYALCMLADAEIKQLVHDFGSGGTAQHAPLPLHKRIEALAAEQPDATAITFRDKHLTYAQLDRRANQLAHYLLARGVGEGSHVAVSVDPSFDIVICILGIFKVGATHVPLDPSYPMDRLQVILEDTQPRVVLTQAALLPKLPPLSAPTLCLDRDRHALEAMPNDRIDIEVRPEQVAYLIYTSGTTGKPKAVMASHGNLINYVQVAVDRYEVGKHDVVPALARFSFSITFFELFLPLIGGGRLIILERDHVLDFKRLIATLQEATLVHASPSLLRKLVGYVRDNGIDPQSFQTLRHVSSGGDMVAADLLEALKTVFPNAELFVIYGSSEIACMGCTYPVPRDHVVTKSRVGKPFPNVQVRLYDPEQNLVPIGVAGEIYFGGDGVSLGYLNRPDLTAEKYVVIDGQRFYRMGDLGRYDAAGNIEILGRSDFQIKLRGIRIELGDVEATLRMADGVREGLVSARAIGDHADPSDKSLVAYVVLEPGRHTDVKDVRRFMQAKLPDYMIPSCFVVLDALPVNINNKVDRRALPDPTAADLARLRTVAPPRTGSERKLVAIWERQLNSSPIGVRDSYFDVGGDSLSALPLMIEIEREFGKALPMSLLLSEPTIEGLARVLDSSATAAREPLVLLRPGTGKPALFLVHDGEGETIPYRNLALELPAGHAIYGIQPHSIGPHPMLHTRIGDVAEHYVRVIQSVQPEGPYMVGGLCIGGFLAFEMAQILEKRGHHVALIALIDVAHVTIPYKSLAVQRLGRLQGAMKGGGDKRESQRERAVRLIRTVSKKISNVIAYETKSRAERAKNEGRMRLFRFCLDHDLPLPRAVQNIPVRVALRFAEKEYVIPGPYQGKGNIVLFRATQKDPVFDGTVIDDTPYVQLFDDPNLGWDARTAPTVQVHDIPGGHSSMLQPPNVQALAKLMRDYMTRA